MRQSTKEAIAETFVEMLREKSIEKITIKDIVNTCGVNRQTFYYHFADIYDLMDWTLEAYYNRYVEEHKSSAALQDRLSIIYEFFYSYRVVIMHAYDSENRIQYERFLYKHAAEITEEKISTYPQAAQIPKEKRAMIIRFYAWTCGNLVFEWLESGAPNRWKTFVDDFYTILNSSIGGAIEGFMLASKGNSAQGK